MLHRLFGLSLSMASIAWPCSTGGGMLRIQHVWAPGKESRLLPFQQQGKIGFINRAGKVVIEPTIEGSIWDLEDFRDGFARVGDDSFIDESGSWVIRDGEVVVPDPTGRVARLLAFRHQWISSAHLDGDGQEVSGRYKLRIDAYAEDIAAYRLGKNAKPEALSSGRDSYLEGTALKGLIHRDGGILTAPLFADLGPFREGLAQAVLDGHCYLPGRRATPATLALSSCGGYVEKSVPFGCPVGFIDASGDFVIPPQFDEARDFHEGRAAVRINGLWGFVHRNGGVAIAPAYEHMGDFQEGLAAVKLNGLWGYIDLSGRLVIAPIFSAAEDFSDSLALVEDGGREAYIDKQGSATISGSFVEASPFVNGIGAVRRSYRHVSYIDKTGSTVFDYFLE